MPARAVDQLAELAGRGIRIRTRALVTTLFARLLLGDLFLHGIGGAKYDQVTDAIIERFFGLKPPRVYDGDRHAAVADRAARGHRGRRPPHSGAALRDQTYHPERHLAADGDATLAALVERKRQWIATGPTPENARLRCRNIRAANEQMQPYLDQQRRQLLAERAAIEIVTPRKSDPGLARVCVLPLSGRDAATVDGRVADALLASRANGP